MPDAQHELLDNLYELQSVRERGNVSPDQTVIGNEIAEDCTYLIDYSTCTKELDDRGVTQKLVYDGTEVILSNLPVNEKEFDGAILWVRGAQEGIELPNGQVSRNIAFYIGGTLTVQCASIDTWSAEDSNLELMDFDPDVLASMIKVPESIYPLPITKEDEREVPDDLEKITDPLNGAYTLGARIFDTEVTDNLRLIADRVGSVNFGTELEPECVMYRVQVSEEFDDLNWRESEFDRELNAAVWFSQEVPLEVVSLGVEQPYLINQESIRLKVSRKSIFIYGLTERGDKVLYKATEKTQEIIDVLLGNADVTPSNP